MEDVLAWDAEKEARYNVKLGERDAKVFEIEQERAEKKADKERKKKEAEDAAAKAAQEAKDGAEEGEAKSDAGAAEEAPVVDVEEAAAEEGNPEEGGPAEAAPADEEGPIDIKVEADSDDDFSPIEIKE